MFPNNLHIIFVSLSIVIGSFAGCGLISLLRHVNGLCNIGRVYSMKGFIFQIPLGYVLIYGIYTIGYTASFGNSSVTSGATVIVAVLVGAFSLPFVFNREWLTQKAELKVALLILMLVFSVTVIPLLVLGKLPFAVSDQWTHISYINRLLSSSSTVVSGAWLPNEIYAVKFAPHHAFLALIGRLTGSTALEVWVGASFFLPSLAILSYLSFVDSAFPDLTRSRKDWIFLSLSFVLLFRISDDLFRGTADYRIASCIIFFQVARYIMLSIDLQQKQKSIAALFIACVLTVLVAITHLVEVMILLLMFVPYFLVSALKYRSYQPVFISMAWSIFTVIIALTVLHLFYSGFSMPLDKQTTLDLFWPFFRNMFEYFISLYVFIACLIALFILWEKRSSAFAFIACCCGSAFVFSPINSLLFGKLMHFVGANLVWRTIFVFPTYLAIGAALVVTFRQISFRTLIDFNKRTLLYSAWILGAVAAILLHLTSWWHLDGSLGYQHSDSVSQLRLFPNLYKELANYEGEVILSDTLTSAPINVVTPNYIVTHRPWTEGPEVGRFRLATETLKNPTTSAAHDAICKWKVSLFVVNTAPFPMNMQVEIKKYPWLRNDFYGSRDEYKKVSFLKYLGVFDGVDIYKVDRSEICKT